MLSIIKPLIVGLVLGLVIALSIPPAEAHMSKRPVAYIIAKTTYKVVDNDDYLEIFNRSHFRKNGWVGDVLAHAADDVCHAKGGKLEEDFSCSTPN